MQTIFGLLLFASAILVSVLVYFFAADHMRKQDRGELKSMTLSICRSAEIYIDRSVRNYLKGVAEKNRGLAAYYYKLYRDGRLEEGDAFGKLRSVMLDPAYGKIGVTGYLAGVNSESELVIHPVSEGTDAGIQDFVREAARMKNGYIEYEWRNPGEKEKRQKAGYLSYFGPWDLISWATIYKDELAALIDTKDLGEKIGAFGGGKFEPPLVIDMEGAPIACLDGKSGEACVADAGLQNAVREMIRNGEGAVRYKNSESGPDMLAYYKCLPELKWIVISRMSCENVESILRKIVWACAGAIFLACIGNYVVVALIFSRLLMPIGHIREVSNAVSQGDLTNRLQLITKDEIGEVSEYLNTSVDGFEKILRNIKSTSAALADSVRNLSVSSQEISATANQQSASVKEIVSTMEDSDQLAKSIAERIDDVAHIANDTKDTVSRGFSTINDSFKKMEEIRESNAERISVIKSLSAKIDSIWEIVNIINAIADQTRIIAFNAELEASAAGDAGKNFNIVASEIRRLADSTVSSTGEIKARITEIQHASDHLILASERGTMKIAQGWKLSNSLNEVFEEILNSSEKSAESAETIVQSVNHQVSAFHQTLQTLKQISEGVENFVVSTRSTKNASERLQDMADSLNSLIEKYKVRENGSDTAK